MNKSMMTAAFVFALVLTTNTFASEKRFIHIEARTKQERTKLAELGVSLEAFYSDSIWGFASAKTLTKVKNAGFRILDVKALETGRGGHDRLFGFPSGDDRFHDYNEMKVAISELATKNPEYIRVMSIGKTIEGRDIPAMHINSSPNALKRIKSNKPGFVLLGNHHAREHLSAEIPLMFAQYLMANKNDSMIKKLLDDRDLWIVPMVNPDGVEFDISGDKYHMWRKNRRNNGDGTAGVDLNRNYGFRWNTGGSSSDTDSEVYMGKAPFSEPETQAVRDFVSSLSNVTVLLTVHTFSELILYPWGSSYDPIPNEKDRKVFETMANTMAKWNHYKPQQSSDLYIASGDTCDWAYGEKGIFAFTFELSPKNMWDGGFYPGAKVIDRVFDANLKPLLYMLNYSENPYRVLDRSQHTVQANSFLKNLVYLD